MRSPLPAKQSPKTKAAVVLMPGSGAQMFDRLPGRGAKLGLSPDTERLPCTEEGGKIAFHGFRQIIEFKSPVYNSSWLRRILSIYLRSHFPFFLADNDRLQYRSQTSTRCSRHPSQWQLSSTAKQAGPGLPSSMRFEGQNRTSINKSELQKKKKTPQYVVGGHFLPSVHRVIERE